MQLTKINNIMKKVIMIIAAAFMVLACGGNKSQDPYTKYLDQAYEAMENGDYELAEELLIEYQSWFVELDEAEMEEASARLEQWYESYGEEFEAMYEEYLDEVGDYYDDLDYEGMLGEYEELLEEYDEEELLEAYEEALEAYDDEVLEAYGEAMEEALDAYGDSMEDALDAYEDALDALDW